MSEHVVTESSDGILRIQLNRPEKKNALTADMYAGLADALTGADADPAVRVVLIHGLPGCFTAGNDLNDFLANRPASEDSPVFRFLRALSAAQKPLIAAVSGVAVGIGTTLLLHCDLVFAGENTRFQLPFVNLGLCPEAASSLLLPRLAGYQRAAELLLLGEVFDADKALEIGLANAVYPDAQLLDEALSRARRMALLPTAALRITKGLMKQALAAPVAEAMRNEGAQFRQRLDSPEAKEAFSAFLEKRKPDFSRFG